jgi:glycosyltransferase involved in cell wall biosynthesis
MVINSDTADPQHTEGDARVRRRTDFDLMRDALGADVVDTRTIERHLLGRLARRLGGNYAGLAVCARLRAGRYDAVWCDNENAALVLSMLLTGARRRPPLATIAVYPGKPVKRRLFTALRLHRRVDAWLVQGTEQARVLVEDRGVPADRVLPAPFGVDTVFWDPALAQPAVGPRPYVFAAGLQHRDYDTLIAACDGLDVELRVAASSLWSKSPNRLAGRALPSWVQLGRFSYQGLRDQYAGAVAVVASTEDVDFPAGLTSVLEGMAMARPVVVSASRGLRDSVADRRNVLRTDPSRRTDGTYARTVHPDRLELHGQTGLYVPVGDAAELRRALRWILTHPDEAAGIGRRARQVAGAVHDVTAYVGRGERVVRELLAVAR